MACALTRRFSNSSFFTIHDRFVCSTNLLSPIGYLPSFFPYFHCALLSLSLSFSFLLFHLYSCLSLSLSLSLVFSSKLTQFFFLFFVNSRLIRWRCENFTRANRPCFFSTRLRLGLDFSFFFFFGFSMRLFNHEQRNTRRCLLKREITK